MGHQGVAVGSAVRFLIALSITCLFLINGSSAFLERVAPTLAATINPFNTTAQLNHLSESLHQEPGEPDLHTLEAIATNVVLRSPSDARAYSTLAEIVRQRGNAPRANRLFQRSLSLDPTNFHATVNMIRQARKKNAVPEVLRRIDVVGRLWPHAFPDLLPVLEDVAQEETAAAQLKNALLADPPWRSAVLQYFIARPQGRTFVENLHISEAARGKSGKREELNHLMSWFIENGAVRRAHNLFLQTLNAEGRREIGNVFNPNFRPDLGGSPFDWTKPKCPDSDVRWTGAAEGLALRFLGKPAKACAIQQVLVVPPGKANWVIRVTADKLEVPAGLHWKLFCDRGTVLAKIDIPPGSYGPIDLTQSIYIPNQNCTSQRLELSTGEHTSSWRNRYSGTIKFHVLDISS